MRFLKLPLLALAFTPLIFYGGALFPYIFPKTLFIRLMVTIFWLGFAALLLFRPRIVAGLDIARRPKNPIFLSVSAFIFLAAISTLFAANPYRAFWGDVERGEGLTGLLFFFGFFAGAVLVFTRADWKKFFFLTVLTAVPLFLDQATAFLTGKPIFLRMGEAFKTSYAGSLTGNPTFLAAVYLFVIFAAAMLWAREKHGIVENVLLGSAIGFAAVGILLTRTRGAIAGLGAAIVAVLFFAAFSKIFSTKVRQIAGALLVLVLVFIGMFIGTRHSAFWQRVPGLDEIATFSLSNTMLQTRLIGAETGVRAMNPSAEGFRRLFFGWGLENYNIVFQKYYDPKYLRYEAAWFDRAHDKLIDVLAMTGVLGLLAYLAIWFFAFRAILRKPVSYESAALLFFGVSYFIQNLFVFDTISTYIPFFAFLAYVAFRQIPTTADSDQRKSISPAGAGGAGLLASFYFGILIVTLIVFAQTLRYIPAVASNDARTVVRNFPKIIVPYTYAQAEIRTSLLVSVLQGFRQNDVGAARPFLLQLTEAAKDAAERERTNARYYLSVATAYEILDDLKTAEIYRQKSLELAPKRQELLYSLALNYVRQGRSEDAMRVADEMLRLEPTVGHARVYYAIILSQADGPAAYRQVMDIVLSVFDGPVPFVPGGENLSIIRNLFNMYLSDAYQRKDAARFLGALEAFKQFEERYEAASHFAPSTSLQVQAMIEAFKAKGWAAFSIQ